MLEAAPRPRVGCIEWESRANLRYGYSHPRRRSPVSVRAFILIETEVGMADAVSASVRTIDGIVAADDVTGPYDVIVQAEADSVHDLGKMVVSKVQLIEGITRTLTCPVISL